MLSVHSPACESVSVCGTRARPPSHPTSDSGSATHSPRSSEGGRKGRRTLLPTLHSARTQSVRAVLGLSCSSSFIKPELVKSSAWSNARSMVNERPNDKWLAQTLMSLLWLMKVTNEKNDQKHSGSAVGSAFVLLIIGKFNISSGFPFYIWIIWRDVFHLLSFLDFIVLFVLLKSVFYTRCDEFL